MRRTEREITDRATIDEILHMASVLQLAMVDGDAPYVVPMNFGYDGTTVYLHSAMSGHKIDLLRRNPRVCFTVVGDTAVIPAEIGCKWSARYRSVIGTGQAIFIEDPEEKTRALDLLLRKFSPKQFTYQEEVLARTAVIAITIESLTGKAAGY